MQSDQKQTWTAYEPDQQNPWTIDRVVHLHRRAGFAATWEEVQRDLSGEPQEAVTRLLNGKSRMTGVPDDFAKMSQVIGGAAVDSSNPNRLKAWWLYRMLFSPDPLGERLTLMWHNHFATSNIKISDVNAMRRQNQIFRDDARGQFSKLLPRVVKDPAVLIWLDADSNRKQHPNENLARELMELFSMGVGNYTEADVKEAARALTGWTTKRDEFRFVEAYHDTDPKTLLGKTGNFQGDDVLRAVLDHPATARRLCWRLCDEFFGETGIEQPLVDELANELRNRDLDINWAVEKILRSRAFFDNRNLGNRVLGPVEFIVGAIRALEMLDPPPSTLALSEWTARLGQDLFYPPNVFGWPSGRSWITTRSMIGRASFASELVRGQLKRPVRSLDIARLRTQGRGESPDSFVQACATLLVPRVEKGFCDRLRHASSDLQSDDGLLQVVERILASPEAQLG